MSIHADDDPTCRDPQPGCRCIDTPPLTARQARAEADAYRREYGPRIATAPTLGASDYTQQISSDAHDARGWWER